MNKNFLTKLGLIVAILLVVAVFASLLAFVEFLDRV